MGVVMNIKLYVTKSDKKVLNKSLDNELSIDGGLTNECSIINPTIKLGFNADILSKNYVYVPDFGRYYFITDTVIDGKTILLTLHVDVLMSFKNDIKQSTAHITRSNKGSKYIPDSMIKKLPKFTYNTYKLGGGFTQQNNYILVVGGDATSTEGGDV